MNAELPSATNISKAYMIECRKLTDGYGVTYYYVFAKCSDRTEFPIGTFKKIEEADKFVAEVVDKLNGGKNYVD